MEFHRITKKDDALYEAMMELFVASFPMCERRPRDWFDLLLVEEPRFHCVVYGECDAMLCYWVLECASGSFAYVEYLAVRQELRCKGIGTKVMAEFMSLMKNVPVLLEVELPVCHQTKKRVAFYERLGLTLMPDYYMQPSYGVVPGLEMKLMVAFPNGECMTTVADMARVVRHEVYVKKI